MHKQELINKYTDRLNGVLNLGAIQIFSDLINDLKKLDGPEKVTIPQLIAEKIEYCKETDGYSLFHAMDYCYNFKECADWLESNEEVFARAWIDGYEVEKEPKYTVMVKGVFGYGRYLNQLLSSKEYFFASENEISGYRTKHTRKQLEEAGFGWVFDCDGIEIEEVE